MSSSQPIIRAKKRTHRVFSQNSPSLPQNSVRLSEFSSPKHQERKRNLNPKVFGPDIFGWGRGLPRELVGAKKFGMSS